MNYNKAHLATFSVVSILIFLLASIDINAQSKVSVSSRDNDTELLIAKSDSVHPSNVVFSGTTVTMKVLTTGGNADGWSFLWDDGTNGIENSRVVTNTAETVSNQEYFVNVKYTDLDCAIVRYSTDLVFPIRVYSSPDVTFNSPQRTEYYSNESLDFSVSTKGGDANSWEIEWYVNGAKTATGTTFTANLSEYGQLSGPLQYTVSVKATNAPEGVAIPYECEYSSTYTVYPLPSLQKTTKENLIIFSGSNVEFGVNGVGGKSTAWKYSWTFDGASLEGESTSILPQTLVNDTEQAVSHEYTVTALNEIDGNSTELSDTFYVTVWPIVSIDFSEELPINVMRGDQITVEIMKHGGDESAWTFKYSLGGKQLYNGASNKCNIEFETAEKMEKSVFLVEATNTPNGIEAPMRVSLSHEFTIWGDPQAVSVCDNEFSTFSGRPCRIGVDPISGPNGEWFFEWTHNGEPVDINGSQIELSFYNDEKSIITESYTVKSIYIVNDVVRYENTESYVIDVYQAPISEVKPILSNYYYGNSVAMSVETNYGYPDGWTYTWTENLPATNEVVYTIPSYEDDSFEKVISVNVKNKCGDDVWFDETYDYAFNCWSRGQAVAIPLPNHFNGEIDTTLVASIKGGYANGWSYSWTRNGEAVEGNEAQYDVYETNNGDIREDYIWTLLATNELNGEVGCQKVLQYEYTIWPQIETPDEFNLSRTAVRNGGIVEFATDKAATGGYLYRWYYDWIFNGETKQSAEHIFSNPMELSNSTGAMTTEDINCELRLFNEGPDKIWCEILYPAQKVTVYAAPMTPSELLRKGSGKSCILIAMSDLSDSELEMLKYEFVFGYTDSRGNEYVQQISDKRYCQYPIEVYNNKNCIFWVYTQWSYPDGSVVTSNRCELRGSSSSQQVEFDGSKFDNSGRGESAGITSPSELSNHIHIDATGFAIDNLNNEKCNVRVFDMSGNQIFNREYDQCSDVSESFANLNIAAGVYIFIVESNSNTCAIKSIVK